MKFSKIVIVIILIFISSGTLFHWARTNNNSPIGWEELRIPFLDKHTVILFERKHAHYFLAEYHRRIRVNHYGPRESQKIVKLPPHVGAKTNIKLYYDNKFQSLYFHQGSDVHLIDLKTNCTSTTLKDPDLDIPFCQNRFFNMNDFDFASMEYIGEISSSKESGSLILK